MILLLFINLILADYIPPLPCPVPEDRANAKLVKDSCYKFYTCCFNEIINDIETSCCYAYGNDGPYKCCGRSEYDPLVAVTIIFLFAALITFYIIYYRKT